MTAAPTASAADHASPSPAAAYPDWAWCPKCGQHLRGVAGPRCPECGLDLAFIESAESSIPWVHRRERGRVRAYLATVLLVLFRPRRVFREFYRPVAYSDARRFWWVTNGLVGLALAAFAADYVFRSTPDAAPAFAFVVDTQDEAAPVVLRSNFARWADFVGVSGASFATAGVIAALWLTLIAVGGAPTYLFHPRSLPLALQNRAVALAYYIAGGVIALLVPLLAAAWALRGWALEAEVFAPLYEDAQFVLPVLAIAVVVLWLWVKLLRLSAATLRRFLWTARVGLVVPLLWLSFAVGAAVFGVSIAYLGVIADSVSR